MLWPFLLSVINTMISKEASTNIKVCCWNAPLPSKLAYFKESLFVSKSRMFQSWLLHSIVSQSFVIRHTLGDLCVTRLERHVSKSNIFIEIPPFLCTHCELFYILWTSQMCEQKIRYAWSKMFWKILNQEIGIKLNFNLSYTKNVYNEILYENIKNSL